MLKLMWLFVAQSHFVDCGCMCVEGMPRTLCQSVAEARQQPNMCGEQVSCPAPFMSDEKAPAAEAPIYYDAPAEHAQNCREVRVWDAAADAYAGVKVCDVFTG